MRKKERAAIVIERLKEAYPDVECTLEYDDAWKLLVSVRLAAQCTDERVNVVVQGLYEKYPGIRELAAAEPEDIEAIVKPCGLGHSKARDISKAMRMLRDDYDCKVPDDFDELMKLPGVGRKSANLVMGDVFGKPAIVTDTHCIRLCNRIGLVDDEKDPKKVEMALWKIIPPEEGNDFCHRLVYHGREVCTARTIPYCEKCVLRDVCREYPKLEKLKTQKAKRAQAAKTTAANKGKSGRGTKEKKS
ncbi:MAG: endonuclease III [Eubacterium sp.]|nr:endonuclease III [Eubacterium sp.]